MATVGVVGLGLLGHAVAARLIAAGHAVVGHDVVRDRVDALVALGGKPAASAEAVTRAADPVCTILPSLASVEEVVLGPSGIAASARSGQTLVQMSTISPALTARLARGAAERGLAFLDCPVSGTSAMVARGDGLLLVGGEAALVERGDRSSRPSCRAPSTWAPSARPPSPSSSRTFSSASTPPRPPRR